MITIIAEKPSVAKEIAKIVGASTKQDGYLEGKGYAVTWAYGHLVGLESPEAYGYKGAWDKAQLPMMPEQFMTAPISTGTKDSVKLYKKQLTVIAGLFKKSQKIIVATDAGREGELIFRYIYNYLSAKHKFNTPFDRLWISSLTDKAIREGLANLKPGREYDNLFYAGRSRSEADWLIGMNGTRAVTLNVADRTVWSVGRVQTPTLCMVCKRWLENTNFKSEPYWMIKASFSKAGISFFGNNNTKYTDKAKADEMWAQLSKNNTMTVRKVEKKPAFSSPPLLYDLTTIQKEANSKYGFSADMTLKLCQSLYEKKLTTYPRTGSRYIPDDIYETLPMLIQNAEKYPRFAEYAKSMKGQPLAKVSVNAAKVTDHHALLPTENVPGDGSMTEAERKIYEMILGRMLETVSPKEEKFVTTATISADNTMTFPFVVKGSVVIKQGWKAVFAEKAKVSEDENDVLPNMVEGEQVEVQEIHLLDKHTKAPALLTENSLLALMETAGKELENEEEREAMKDIGIGTPATRAEIIEKILRAKYIERQKKNLIPTEKGLNLYKTVKDMMIANVEMTGKWENALNKIERGKIPVERFNDEIRKYTVKCTEELLNATIEKTRTQLNDKTLNFVCPKCGSPLLVSDKICKCSNKDNCTYFFWRVVCQRKLTEKDISEILANGKTIGKIKLKRKDGKVFEAQLILGEDGKFTFGW